MKELIAIQAKLKAPKERRSEFGKYNYRKAEDILKAVKPLLEEYSCVLLLSDEVKEIGNPYSIHTEENDKSGRPIISDYTGTRIYVEATATLINSTGDVLSVKGFAREDVAKKGMDAAQITGTTSSYARKYALNGLFAIDDSVDNAEPTNTVEDEALNKAVEEMKSVKSRQEMNAVWEKYPLFKENTQFRNACIEAGKKYPQT